MKRYKTVLVLGAGASKCFGYPVGLELREEILSLWKSRKHLAETYGLLGQNTEALGEFIQNFAQSQMYSIDAFLARRPEYSEIGKLAIAALLLSKESPNGLMGCNDSDNWYRYFFNTVAHEEWSALDFSNLAIISFNYDRCLETYFLFSLAAAYKINEQQLVEKVKTLKVVHVYGSLGPTLPDAADYFHYGNDDHRRNVGIAAKALKVIPEGRDNDPTLLEAQQILQSAGSIAFLGFGYDQTNLRRLNARSTCTQTPSAERPRRVLGTCLGMTVAEAGRAARNSFWPTAPADLERLPYGMYDMTCLQFLRETLILD